MPNIQISHILKKQYPGKFRFLNTTPDVLTSDVGLPSASSYTNESVEKFEEMNAFFVLPSREFDTRAQALLFGT